MRAGTNGNGGTGGIGGMTGDGGTEGNRAPGIATHVDASDGGTAEAGCGR